MQQAFVEAESGHAGEEPGDVRRRSRRGADHGVPGPRHRRPARPESASSSRSPCGSGSRCCSPTSPRRWRKRAARRRPTRCARPRPTSWPSGSVAAGAIETGVRPRRCAPATSSSCEAGDVIPGDGEVIEGIATVDESVITGESAPVIRESGGDRSAVTGGTRVLSDQIKIRITSNPGETFLDRMIALVEGARAPEDAERDRAEHPDRRPDAHLPAGGGDAAALRAFTASTRLGAGTVPSVAVLVALLVCLIPTTIGGLLSAIGIAGMDRVMQHNVLAMSGKAVEAAGDVNTLLLDKTGTITLGNRQAVEFLPVAGVTDGETGRRRPALQPGRRDAGRAVDRRAREGEVRPARPRRRRARRARSFRSRPTRG